MDGAKQRRDVISEIVEDHLDEVEKLTEEPDRVASVPEEIDLKESAPPEDMTSTS